MNEILFREEVEELMEASVGDYSISYSVGLPYVDTVGNMHIDVDIFSGAENEYLIMFEPDDHDHNEIAIQGDGYQEVADVQGVLISLFYQAEGKIK